MNTNIIHRFILSITLLGLVSAQTVVLNDKTITILKDEVVLEVNGLVCSFCAMGLQGGLSSLKYIDGKKYNNGVFVNVECQYAVIAEMIDHDINVDEAITMITKSGYEVLSVYTNRTGEKIEVRKFEAKKKDEK